MPRINYPPNWTQRDRDELDQLFAEARAKGLWFYHGGLSGTCWFTPDELQQAQEGGAFIWGAVNWKLRPPTELLDQYDKHISTLMSERQSVEKRMVGMPPEKV